MAMGRIWVRDKISTLFCFLLGLSVVRKRLIENVPPKGRFFVFQCFDEVYFDAMPPWRCLVGLLRTDLLPPCTRAFLS